MFSGDKLPVKKSLKTKLRVVRQNIPGGDHKTNVWICWYILVTEDSIKGISEHLVVNLKGL